MVRIHHEDLDECHLVLQPCFLEREGPFIALSCSYVGQGWQHGNKRVGYIEALAGRVGCRCYCTASCRAVIWLTLYGPATLLCTRWTLVVPVIISIQQGPHRALTMMSARTLTWG